MKQLSYWALLNPVKAQIIIILCQLLLAALAFYSGLLLFREDVFVPKPVLYLGLALFLTGLALYPIRRARYKFWKYNYTRQKLMDAFLVLGFVLMAVTVTNNDAHAVWRDTTTGFEARQTMLESGRRMNAHDLKAKGWSFREMQQTLKSRYKSFLAKVRQAPGEQMTEKGKVALVVFLMVLLMLALVVLACAVACSGGDGWGLVIWLGGWALVLIIGISTIRKIRGQRPNRYKPMDMGG